MFSSLGNQASGLLTLLFERGEDAPAVPLLAIPGAGLVRALGFEGFRG